MRQRKHGPSRALRVLARLLPLLLALSPASRAQTPTPLPEWYLSQGILLEANVRADSLPTWQRLVGVSLETQPKYAGGNAYTTAGGPSFDIRYRDIAFASTGEGLGVNLLHTSHSRAGVALAYDLGRDQDSDHHLHGLGDVGIAPEVKLFGEYLFFPVTVRVDGRYSLGGQGGWTGDLSIYTPLAGNEHFFVFAGPSISFADETNMRHNFGVTPRQATASGYPAYRTSAGIRSASFGLSGGYFFTSHWLLTGMLAGELLTGSAANSPFVQEDVQNAVTLTFAYLW